MRRKNRDLLRDPGKNKHKKTELTSLSQCRSAKDNLFLCGCILYSFKPAVKRHKHNPVSLIAAPRNLFSAFIAIAFNYNAEFILSQIVAWSKRSNTAIYAKSIM